MDTDEKVFLGALGLAMSAGAFFLRAHVITCLWRWFAPEEAFALSYIDAMWLSVFYPVLTARLGLRDTDNLPKNSLFQIGFVSLSLVLLYWGIGAAVHWSMTN